MARRGDSDLSVHQGGGLAGWPASIDVEDFAARLRRAASVEELSADLAIISRELGFGFPALAHHADLANPADKFLFLQNYPAGWVDAYACAGLHRYDPARRYAAVRPGAFDWDRLDELTDLSGQERRVMDAAERAGLGQGFTIPLHVPGERTASCSFVTEAGEPLPADRLLAAELLAHIAFAALFDLLHPDRVTAVMRLTPRQLECVELMAQGKTDWEIGKIVGLTRSSVTTYLQSARRRVGVARRTQLAMAATSFGLIGFDEIRPPTI